MNWMKNTIKHSVCECMPVLCEVADVDGAACVCLCECVLPLYKIIL